MRNTSSPTLARATALLTSLSDSLTKSSLALSFQSCITTIAESLATLTFGLGRGDGDGTNEKERCNRYNDLGAALTRNLLRSGKRFLPGETPTSSKGRQNILSASARLILRQESQTINLEDGTKVKTPVFRQDSSLRTSVLATTLWTDFGSCRDDNKRSVVSSPIVNITIENTTDLNPSKMELIFNNYDCGVSCEFWNETSESWSTQGCRTSTTAEGRNRCICSHLTEFALLSRSRPTGETDPCEEAFQTPSWARAVFGLLFGAFVVAGGFASYQIHYQASRKKYFKTYAGPAVTLVLAQCVTRGIAALLLSAAIPGFDLGTHRLALFFIFTIAYIFSYLATSVLLFSWIGISINIQGNSLVLGPFRKVRYGFWGFNAATSSLAFLVFFTAFFVVDMSPKWFVGASAAYAAVSGGLVFALLMYGRMIAEYFNKGGEDRIFTRVSHAMAAIFLVNSVLWVTSIGVGQSTSNDGIFAIACVMYCMDLCAVKVLLYAYYRGSINNGSTQNSSDAYQGRKRAVTLPSNLKDNKVSTRPRAATNPSRGGGVNATSRNTSHRRISQSSLPKSSSKLPLAAVSESGELSLPERAGRARNRDREWERVTTNTMASAPTASPSGEGERVSDQQLLSSTSTTENKRGSSRAGGIDRVASPRTTHPDSKASRTGKPVFLNPIFQKAESRLSSNHQI